MKISEWMQQNQQIGAKATWAFLRKIRKRFSMNIVFDDKSYNVADLAEKNDAQIRFMLLSDGLTEADVESAIEMIKPFRQ